MIDLYSRTVLLSCVLLASSACSDHVGGTSGKRLGHEPASLEAGFMRVGRAGVSPPMTPIASTANAVAGFTFMPLRQYRRLSPRGTMANYEALHAADFTGDGRIDLMAMPSENQIDLFVQQADGSLTPPLIYTYAGDSSTMSTNMVSNDFNGDGLMDVAFGRVPEGTDPGGISVLLSTGNGPPVYRVAHSDYANLSRAITATLDVDGDGHHDVVAAHNDTDYDYLEPGAVKECGVSTCPRYTVFYGDGKGGFGRPTVFKLGLPLLIEELDAHDLNEDGRTDLVMVLVGGAGYVDGYSGEVRVAYSLPKGGLSSSQFIHSAYEISGGFLTFGDLNGDGLDDSLIAPSAQRDRMHVRMRMLTGGFGPPLALYHDNLSPSVTLIADFDGNGRVDLLNHQFGEFGTIAYLSLYLQAGGTLQAPMTFQDPPLDAGMDVSRHQLAYAAGDFNGDGCKDLAIAARNDGVLIMDGSNCLPRLRHLPDETGSPRIFP